MARFDWRRVVGLFGPDRSRGATNHGPDFPDSAGDRERGRHRPSEYPRMTQVAVCEDDGNRVGTVLIPHLAALTEEVRKLRLALTVKGIAEDLGDLE